MIIRITRRTRVSMQQLKTRTFIWLLREQMGHSSGRDTSARGQRSPVLCHVGQHWQCVRLAEIVSVCPLRSHTHRSSAIPTNLLSQPDRKEGPLREQILSLGQTIRVECKVQPYSARCKYSPRGLTVGRVSKRSKLSPRHWRECGQA